MHQRLDVRHLPAPEPMERILDAVQALQPGTGVEALAPRRPGPLLAILDDWGYPWRVVELPDGSALVAIVHPQAGRGCDAPEAPA